jgi:heme A synthase
MPPDALALVFLAVMGTALCCFARAFSLRKTTPRHIRWAVAGLVLDVLGTVAVVVTTRGLGWHVPHRSEDVALVHRGFAYVASALLVVQAVTGARRHPVHHRLGPVFLVVYAITYALAVAAYAPMP